MKKLKIILIILLAIFISACTNNEPYEPDVPRLEGREGDALIWRVSSDTATVYLVGTIHVALEDLQPIQQVLLDAFYRSDALAVELDIVAFESDVEAMFRMLEMMMLEDTTVEDHLTASTFALLEAYLAERQPIERNILMGMRVGSLATLLMQEQLEEWGWMEHPGVDQFFLELAHELGMEIIEVESMEFQLEMMNNFSDELQEITLLDILKTPLEEAKDYLEKMYNMWLTGNADGLRNMLDESNEEFAREHPTLFEEYNTAMMINRDIAMTAKIIELLSGNRTIFFAVGAAHMVSEQGIIELLEADGWTVERVR